MEKITYKEWMAMNRDEKYQFCGGLCSIPALDDGGWTEAEQVDGDELIRLYNEGVELGIQQCNEVPAFFELVDGKYLEINDPSIELNPETGDQIQSE